VEDPSRPESSTAVSESDSLSMSSDVSSVGGGSVASESGAWAVEARRPGELRGERIR
jgi:hypothetical protein